MLRAGRHTRQDGGVRFGNRFARELNQRFANARITDTGGSEKKLHSLFFGHILVLPDKAVSRIVNNKI